MTKALQSLSLPERLGHHLLVMDGCPLVRMMARSR